MNLSSLPALSAMLACTLAMRAVVCFYYRDSGPVMRRLRLLPRINDNPETYYRPLDGWLAPLPFVWTWLDIAIAVMLAAQLDTPLLWAFVVLWSGGRMRALQEFGHNAVHFALCPSHAWQGWLSDIFYQFPVFKRDSHSRHKTHGDHHRVPNHAEYDPNRARVFAGGYEPGMSSVAFLARLFYPLSPAGCWNNVSALFRNSLLNRSRLTASARCATLLALGLLLHWIAGWKGVLFGWWLPLLTAYPVFAWISLLTEHRWLISGFPQDKLELEYLMGRPTDYFGITGWLVRVFIAPTSDAYHLAHSLYPGVRWNYLPAIDRHLKINEPRYTAHASEGLLFRRGNSPSALSELRERLVSPAISNHLSAQGVHHD